MDLCCGSGAIGLAIDRESGGVDLHAADVDPAAVACARLNVPADRVHEGDLYDALPSHLRGRVDLLAVNAPYVPTDEIQLMPPEARLHEHHVALDGGSDGLELHRRVAAGPPDWLAPGGTPADRDQSWPGRGGPRPVPPGRADGVRAPRGVHPVHRRARRFQQTPARLAH